MYSKYYQHELQALRELASEFAKVHPAIAPMLSIQTADPDVERLLEGVAFLTGMLHEKLDDDFPEFIHSLMGIILPHYTSVIPSTSIVVFTPKPSLQESIKVRRGTSLATVPVEGTACRFQTCFDLEVHPLRMVAAESIQKAGENNQIRLTLELGGPNLSQWQPNKLGLFLGGSYADSTDLFMLLDRYLSKITLTPVEGGAPCVLSPQSLRPTGFDMQNSLLPFPARSFAGYRLLQEYFVLPRKFLFWEIVDWDKWRDRGRGKSFHLVFEFKTAPVPLPKVSADHFILYATPVINLFPHESDPFILDHYQEKLRLRPAIKNPEHYMVYSVDKVVGYSQGTVIKKEYSPLELFQQADSERPVYQVLRSRSPINDEPEAYLSFTYPPGSPEPEKEILTVTMTCTNGNLPERLQLGDISQQTSDSPELLTFRNVVPATLPIDPPLGGNVLWRFLSHLSLNYLKLANKDNIKDILKLYVFPDSRDRARVAANIKRIEGIIGFEVKPTDRLTAGYVMRGQISEMTVRRDSFAGFGDMYLFGAVMDLFLGVYASMNTFMQFRINESLSGESFTWPARIGDRPLI